MTPVPVTAIEVLGLFAGQADEMPAGWRAPAVFRERAEDLAAFLAAHETCLPDAASFMTLLRIGGVLFRLSEEDAA